MCLRSLVAHLSSLLARKSTSAKGNDDTNGAPGGELFEVAVGMKVLTTYACTPTTNSFTIRSSSFQHVHLVPSPPRRAEARHLVPGPSSATNHRSVLQIIMEQVVLSESAK